MADVRLIARPLSTFPPPETPAHKRVQARFRQAAQWGRTRDAQGNERTVMTRNARKTPFSQTDDELRLELWRIGVLQAVLELDLSERDMRQDGWIRGDAIPRTPRVVLSFEHPSLGALRYPADRYLDWKDNVRAIRLTLEALRAIDRYGVTRKQEQYTGWKALPSQSSAGLNVEAAVRVLLAYDPRNASLDVSQVTKAVQTVLGSVDVAREILRRAARATHPDADGGSHYKFIAVQQARRTLAAHFNVGTL